MKNKFYLQKTLCLLVMLVFGIKGFSQFSGAFAPANWNFNTTTAGGDGSVNTSGAPSYIILNGSDNGVGGGYEQYSITIPAEGKISFNYSHSNFDIDDAQYVINSSVTNITTSGSGSLANIIVHTGDVFSFRVSNYDNCCGRGVLTISNFSVTPQGSALNFDGANDYVSIGTVIPLNSSYTKEAWVYANASGSNNIISSGSAAFWLAGGKLSAFNNGGAVLSDPAAFPLNQWVHVAVTFNATNSSFKLYKNGVLVNSTTTTSGYTNDAIAIGQYGPSAANFFQGSIDEVRIWNVARTQCEINTFKNSEIPTTAAGLLANYHFNQGYASDNNTTVTSLTDVSGNSNTGTVTNFALTGATSNWISPGAIVNNFSTPLTLPSSILTTTNVSCNGGANATVLATTTGGTSSYSYVWSTGATTSFITNVAAGTYTATVTDAASCTFTTTATITQPSALVTTTAVTNIACNGGSNGVASITASGGTTGYTYLWSNGATTSAITGLLAGAYSATVTDANSCTDIKVATVTQPSAIITSTAMTSPLCNGSNGSATVTASGGTGAYSYTWSSGPTTSVEPTLLAGTYTVKVTDANNCSKTSSVTITQPSAVSTSTGYTTVFCNGDATGSATVIASGGTSPYTYTWSTGVTAGPMTGISAITGLTAGSYTVRATDANGCASNTRTINISQPAAIVTTTSITNPVCNGGLGSATITASGGVGSYSYLWSSSPTTSVEPTLSAGTYTVRVTDANNCSRTNTVTITNPPAIVTSTAVTNVACNGGSNGVASITASGGAGGYTYLWSNGGTTSAITGLLAGAYTATVTDANSCTSIKAATVTQPSALATATAVTNVSCNSGSNGVASITASGGTTSYTYLWS
ncbi:MAG: LamG-like jellyroll fold domain-containing protein, partial [Bacteroidota bacterium]